MVNILLDLGCPPSKNVLPGLQQISKSDPNDEAYADDVAVAGA
jgi:hypothetical protein